MDGMGWQKSEPPESLWHSSNLSASPRGTNPVGKEIRGEEEDGCDVSDTSYSAQSCGAPVCMYVQFCAHLVCLVPHTYKERMGYTVLGM